MLFNDDVKAKFGTSSDLQIYHDGSISKIIESTSELQISSSGSNLYIQSVTGENAIKLIPNSSVELYYDSAKKFETTSSGILVTNTGANAFLKITREDASTSGALFLQESLSSWFQTF